MQLEPTKLYVIKGIGENPVLDNKTEYIMNGSNAQKVIDLGEAELVKEYKPKQPKETKIEVIKK